MALATGIANRGSGAPSHTAPEGTMYWDHTNNKLYINNDGSTNWTEIGASGTTGYSVGDMKLHYADTDPAGWLRCYGQAVNRTTYAALFAAIGTIFGAGDGSTTFNVPDMRGRFPLGKDNMGGSSANRVTASQADNIGQSAGAESVTIATSELPSHTHNVRTSEIGFDAAKVGIANPGGSAADITGAALATGSGSARNVMNPYITFVWLIKT